MPLVASCTCTEPVLSPATPVTPICRVPDAPAATLFSAPLPVAAPLMVPMLAFSPSWKPAGEMLVLVSVRVCDCAVPARKLPRLMLAGRAVGWATWYTLPLTVTS